MVKTSVKPSRSSQALFIWGNVNNFGFGIEMSLKSIAIQDPRTAQYISMNKFPKLLLNDYLVKESPLHIIAVNVFIVTLMSMIEAGEFA